MKCPACGAENPETAEWCDLCKDPFAKRRAQEEAARAAASEEAARAEARGRGRAARPKPIPPEVMLKLAEAARRPAPAPAKDSSGGLLIPPEFAHLDPGERLGEVPRQVRVMAWIFLGAVVFWILVGSLWVIRKAGRIRAAAEREEHATAGPAPRPARSPE